MSASNLSSGSAAVLRISIRQLFAVRGLQAFNTQRSFSTQQGKNVMLVGFPGGKVCIEKHLPAYVKKAELLKQKGVDKVVCVSVMEPASISQFPSDSMLDYYADSRGHFLRALGLDLAPPDSTAAIKCQRFAAIVEDGVLLNLEVEKAPAEVQVSDVESMCKLWDKVFAK